VAVVWPLRDLDSRGAYRGHAANTSFVRLTRVGDRRSGGPLNRRLVPTGLSFSSYHLTWKLSPAGVVVVHRTRSSCCERRRPWPQVIDPPQDVGEQRARHRHLGCAVMSGTMRRRTRCAGTHRSCWRCGGR
jgi:hypothetical protein